MIWRVLLAAAPLVASASYILAASTPAPSKVVHEEPVRKAPAVAKRVAELPPPPVVPNREVARKELELKSTQGRWYLEGKPFSGYATKHYPGGELQERVGFVAGKREGDAVSYYPDGRLRKTWSYRNNKQDGVVKFWSNTGILLSEKHYAAGVQHGSDKRWYADGTPFKHRNLVHGREHGMQRAWRRSGKLYVNYEARDGRVFGLKRSTLCYRLEDERVRD